MKCLFLIPARGGSKGIPGKNIKPLAGKPLIYYSIDIARSFSEDADICVSTDDDSIIKMVEDYDLKVPFKRPDVLANDTAGTYEVIEHALDYYKDLGKEYDAVVLLQPTSPFRKKMHVKEAIESYNDALDMVVGAKETESNPYYVLFEEDEKGYLQKSKELEDVTRRQDVPVVYEINGAIYVINVKSVLRNQSFSSFHKRKKIVMDRISSLDLDEMLDWEYAEFLLEKQKVDLS